MESSWGYFDETDVREPRKLNFNNGTCYPMRKDIERSEAWKLFKESFQYYMDLNDVALKTRNEPEKRVQLLLNCMGDIGIETWLRIKHELNDYEKQDISIVMQKFEKEFVPKQNIIHERFQFYTSKQKEYQTTEEFIKELSTKIQTCDFGRCACRNCGISRDDMLRDILVIGIRDQSLRQRLMEDEKLTLEAAINKCKAVESARLYSKEMQEDKNGYDHIDQVRQHSARRGFYQEPKATFNTETRRRFHQEEPRTRFNRGSRTYYCKKCDQKHNIGSYCPKIQCYRCQGFGHLAKDCPNESL